MPDDQRLRKLIARDFPGYEVRSITPMGEGLDHVGWLVNGELVIRQAKEPDADAIRREVAVLEVVARHATLPVPMVVVADPEACILAYRHLPGRPLTQLSHCDMVATAVSLGAFLGAIHGIPLGDVERIVPREDKPLQEWLDEARETYPRVARRLPSEARRRVEAFLAEPPPQEPDRLVFCHNDFGAEHILVDPESMRLTGIIDWSDAAIADPVRDLALILRDLGPDALWNALAGYGRDLAPGDPERIVFHARCKLIEDLAFGLETGAIRYVDAALAHLDWTFGARVPSFARCEKRR